MEPKPPYRDLLLADLALVLGVAPARDIAFALQRFWEKRSEGAGFLVELSDVAHLEAGDRARLEAEVSKLVEEAGGDPRLALGARGGIDRTIHVELSRVEAPLVAVLVEEGAGARASLPVVHEDRYLGFQEIGRGGMGLVYLALDTELNRRVALKVVNPDRASAEAGDPLKLTPPDSETPASRAFRSLSARFLQEAVVTGGLEHPGIVPVYELGRTPKGVPYYTMRFLRGERTLERAIEEAESPEERLALLEPFLKVCDTLAYAHSRGVVHRDLKPANVVLGEFGEAVVIDWGLARIRKRPELSQTTWKERIEEIRDTEDLRTLAGGLGTPGYMAPEAVLGRPEEVDEQSDVYSLGAVLYQVLTGRRPYEFTSFSQLMGKLLEEDPVPPHDLDPAVPEGLSRICVGALSRERSERPQSVRELSAAIRSWQRECAVDREVEGLLHEARTAWEGAENLSGDGLLRQIDRVLGHASRALELRPGEAGAESLVERATEARARALAERVQASRRRTLRRVGVAVLIMALATAGVVAWLLDARRREAVAAERRASEEREAKELALADVLRLADAKKVGDMAEELDDLWPVHPDRAPAMADWLERARELLRGRAAHEAALAVLRRRAFPYTETERLRDHAAEFAEIEDARDQLYALDAQRRKIEEKLPRDAAARLDALSEQAADLTREIAALEARVRERASWRFADATDAWQHQVLADLVAGMASLADGREAILKEVEARRDLAAGLRNASIDEHREEWDRAIAAIADEAESPAYHGLKMEPVLGLVPLGRDPDSGLQEFAHVGSGTVPRRNRETGRLVYEEDSAIVLVLVPGGSFWMGAQKQDPAGQNYDPWARREESPVRHLTLPPYLIGKHECTQAQWAAMTGGERPSRYGAGRELGGRRITERNPVERVNWEEATRWLARHRLRLPTEAEWENACRAGTQTPWITGSKVEDLGTVANIADAYLGEHGPSNWPFTKEVNDGHAYHAPVGSYLPNGFGLHDTHGNVWEWCEDWYGSYGDAPTGGKARTRRRGSSSRVIRGGCWDALAWISRSAIRSGMEPIFGFTYLGLRPAASLPE